MTGDKKQHNSYGIDEENGIDEEKQSAMKITDDNGRHEPHDDKDK